jgi:hypothetical protein
MFSRNYTEYEPDYVKKSRIYYTIGKYTDGLRKWSIKKTRW